MKVLARFCSFHFATVPLIERHRSVLRVPTSDRQPSSGLIRVELFIITGLSMIMYFPPFSKAMMRLLTPDHVSRHPDAAVLVGNERIQKILRNAEVIRRGRLCLLREKASSLQISRIILCPSCKLKVS